MDAEYPLHLPVATPLRLLELFCDNCPDLVRALNQYSRDLEPFHRIMVRDANHPAESLVVTQLVNDFNDVLFDSISGRGRSALRSARSLFELLLNLLLVVNDDEMCERYIAHWHVVVQQSGAHDPFQHRLKGSALKAHRHREKVVQREIADEVAESIRKYGGAFARSWHPSSARDRAELHGLAGTYDFYRVASAAVHGAAAGGAGLFWANEGDLLYRIGPSMLPCAVALATAVPLFDRALDAVAEFSNVSAQVLRDDVGALDREILDFLAYVNGVEQMLLADDPTSARFATLGWRRGS